MEFYVENHKKNWFHFRRDKVWTKGKTRTFFVLALFKKRFFLIL